MSSDLDQYIDDLYDRRLREAAGAVPIAELREKIAPDVELWIAHQDRDVRMEALAAVKARTEHVRRSRTKRLRTDIAYLVDYWETPDEAAQSVEAILDQGYKIGDGNDKTLRYWTRDDLNRAVVTRYRESADAVKAAKDFDEVAQRALDALNVTGSEHLGDLTQKLAA